MKTVWNSLRKDMCFMLIISYQKMSRMHEKLDLFISCKFAFMFKILYWDLLSIKHEKKITSYLHSFSIYDQRRIQKFIYAVGKFIPISVSSNGHDIPERCKILSVLDTPPIPIIISEDNEILTVYFQNN